MELKNEVLSEILTNCDSYVKEQCLLGEIISKAMFQISLARQYDRNSLTVYNCRQDIDASIRLQLSDKNTYEINKSPNDKDPIFYISGMPTKNTRNAQKLFIDALNIVIKLKNNAVAILDEIHEEKLDILHIDPNWIFLKINTVSIQKQSLAINLIYISFNW